jgi:hypothetical protein
MEISAPAVEALRAYLTLDADRMNQLAAGRGPDYEVLSGAAFYLLVRRSVANHGVAADLYASGGACRHLVESMLAADHAALARLNNETRYIRPALMTELIEDLDPTSFEVDEIISEALQMTRAAAALDRLGSGGDGC